MIGDLELGYVVTVKDTAKIPGVSERTVYNWLYKGKIKACGLPGGGWRIPLHVVADLVGLTEQELRIRLQASTKDL
jgi:excisionase family DNA binding protein